MKDVIEFFATDWGALRFLAGFVVAPLIYLKDRSEIHKDYAVFIRSVDSQYLKKNRLRFEMLEGRLHVFEFEWWLVAAITVLFVGVFLMGGVARWSDRFNLDHQGGAPRTSADQGEPAGSDASEAGVDIKTCRQVEGILNAFGFGLALLAVFCVRWAKAEAYRELQKVSFDLAVNGVGIEAADANGDDVGLGAGEVEG